MRNRYLVSCGMAFFGFVAFADGIARILSGTTDLYRGAKHQWLSGFFMIFGSYAPYASALLSLAIGVFFFYAAYRTIRSSGTESHSSLGALDRPLKRK